jgi:hypothetical protein
MFQLTSFRRLALSANTSAIGPTNSNPIKGSGRSAKRGSFLKSLVRNIRMNLIAFHITSVQRSTVSNTDSRTGGWYLTPESEKPFGRQQHCCHC